jgi:glycosyltransferase involved in cell wall biosynthesis
MRRLKVLLSPFACAPAKGSELGVGWNTARELANHHEVWVLTQGIHRPAIETELARHPVPNLHFAYYDLPRWASWWHRRWLSKQPYYYLWQFGAYRVARRLHHEVGIDLAHHVTFVVYWKPSLLALLPVPFIWGPVGGGESSPPAFRADFAFRGMVYEATRDLARWVGERDPFVRLTARRSAVALATTEETAVRLRRLGAERVWVFSQVGLNQKEIDHLHPNGAWPREDPTRFVSVGRLLHWKGFHLGLRAFARARLSDAEYWIVGDGPERERLEAVAKELKVSDQVKFWGRLPRDEALRKLSECHALIHPSLHESGGWVCLEAMALRRPVVSLDLGGPAALVTEETGFKIPAIKPEQVVDELAAVMNALTKDRDLTIRMGETARKRVVEQFNWRKKGAQIAEIYGEVRPS